MHLRLGLGLGILIFFLVFGLLAGAAMDKACTPVAALLDQAGYAAQQGDVQTALRLADKAQKDWAGYSKAIATLADHTPMEEIDSLFAQTLTYLHQGAVTDFAAGCHRLACLITAVSEAHSLQWQNII